MKFSFIRIPTKPTPAFPNKYSFLAPILPVRIINKSNLEKYIDIKALVDSGAEASIFPAAIAKKLDLKINKERIQPIIGIVGQAFKTYLHDIILEVGGWQFNSYACFSFSNIFYPVLGRDGFFNLFEIKIDYLKEIIELNPKVKPLNA